MLAKVPSKLTLVVTIDDEIVNIEIANNKTVADLIKTALVAFAIDEDPERCHLSTPVRLYSPRQTIGSADLESGDVLQLRLPL